MSSASRASSGTLVPSITLDVYSHEFEEFAHADDVSEKLTAAFAGVL